MFPRSTRLLFARLHGRHEAHHAPQTAGPARSVSLKSGGSRARDEPSSVEGPGGTHPPRALPDHGARLPRAPHVGSGLGRGLTQAGPHGDPGKPEPRSSRTRPHPAVTAPGSPGPGPEGARAGHRSWDIEEFQSLWFPWPPSPLVLQGCAIFKGGRGLEAGSSVLPCGALWGGRDHTTRGW